MEAEKYLYKDLTYDIIGCAMEVHNALGPGLLEKVYENSLMVLFKEKNIKAEQQYPVPIYFKDYLVGDYYADILVEDKLILELKSTTSFCDAHIAQTLHYLKATDLKLALLINFGCSKLEYKRIINQR